MIAALLDQLVRPLARRLHAGHMQRLGIAPTMRLAHGLNRLKFGRHHAGRCRLYRDQLDDLLAENGPATCPPITMRDGWALDTSLSLPHLDRVLADSDQIIRERAGVRRTAEGAYRSYFQDMWTPADAERYPSFLDFATSTDVLSVVSRYLQSIPALSTTLPAGIRLVESSAEFDDQPDRPHDSQLYHIDYYSLPNVYVLVLLADTSAEQGPWTFLPRSLSQRVAAELKYWKRGKPYRLSDEEVYSVADPGAAIAFTYPRGSVLFIESSGCLHYGSRGAVRPRYQLMYGYTGACRTDFSETIMKPKVYPIRATDSRLRKMVLDKNWLPEKQSSQDRGSRVPAPHFANPRVAPAHRAQSAGGRQ